MVKCPSCGTELKEVTREWDYSSFHVKRYDCNNCKKSVRAYYYKEKLSHTIPKSS